MVCERRALLVKTFPKLLKFLKLPTHAIWEDAMWVARCKTYSRYMRGCDVGRGSVWCVKDGLCWWKTFPKFTKFPKLPKFTKLSKLPTNKETLESLVRNRALHKNKPQTPLRMTAVI